MSKLLHNAPAQCAPKSLTLTDITIHNNEVAQSVAAQSALRDALDNSQSLFAMIHHIGSSGVVWRTEGVDELLAKQIAENRAALTSTDCAGGK